MMSVKIGSGKIEGPMDDSEAQGIYSKTRSPAVLYRVQGPVLEVVSSKSGSHSVDTTMGEMAHGDVCLLLRKPPSKPLELSAPDSKRPKVYRERVPDILAAKNKGKRI